MGSGDLARALAVPSVPSAARSLSRRGCGTLQPQRLQSPAASSILGTGTVPVSASEKKRGDSMELHFTKAQRRILIGIGIAGYAVFSILLLIRS